MAERIIIYHKAVVRKTAHGEGDNPDTYMLLQQPTILLKPGIRLRLYTRDAFTYTHLGWVMIERIRVAEMDEVEFVVRRSGPEEDEMRGACHFLVVDKRLAAAGWSMKGLVPRLRASWMSTMKKFAPIVRIIPPTPSPSSAALSESIIAVAASTSRSGELSIARSLPDKSLDTLSVAAEPCVLDEAPTTAVDNEESVVKEE